MNDMNSMPYYSGRKRISKLANRLYELIRHARIEDQYKCILEVREIIDAEHPEIKKIETRTHILTDILYGYLSKLQHVQRETLLEVIDKVENIAGYYASLENS